MDDHPRGLVDDDQMLVLERDDKVHVLRDIMRGDRGGQADLDRRGRGGLRRRVPQDRAASPMRAARSEEHTSELQSLMRISYAVFCLKKKKIQQEPQCPRRTQHESPVQSTVPNTTHNSTTYLYKN